MEIVHKVSLLWTLLKKKTFLAITHGEQESSIKIYFNIIHKFIKFEYKIYFKIIYKLFEEFEYKEKGFQI